MMRILKTPYKADSDMAARHASVSGMAAHRHEFQRVLDGMDFPEHVRAEFECGLDIHFDNMLDLFQDELVEAVTRHCIQELSE